MNNKVLLGMSGGVDSSVSAIILKEKGYDVTGITFLFADLPQNNKIVVEEAGTLASILKINHIVVDLRAEFEEKVVQYFIHEYINGRTPFPCAYCNPEVKFRFLVKFARKEGCSFISTGHYANIQEVNNNNYIFKGVDPDKDQSFFLWGLKKELTSKLLFPLGSFYKSDIREIAAKNGFSSLSTKRDSLGICFIEGNDYRKFLEKKGIKSKPGNFVDKEGQILGMHRGIINYTVGQRHGLGINLNFRGFVSEFRLDANEIVLSEFDDLYKEKLVINNYYFIDNEEIKFDRIWDVKIRYRLQLTPCRIHILDEVRAEVYLLKSEAMIAVGQTAVFYDGERLVGGGFIEQSF